MAGATVKASLKSGLPAPRGRNLTDWGKGLSLGQKECIMKTLAIIIVILAVAFVAAAQDAPAKKSNFAREKKSTARIERRVVPREVVRKKAATEGIVVQCVLADSPLQLINPLAPASYGNGEQNVVRDPVGGRVSGWKILRVRF